MVPRKGISATGEWELFIGPICRNKVPVFRANKLISLHKNMGNKTFPATTEEAKSSSARQKSFQEETNDVAILGVKEALLTIF